MCHTGWRGSRRVSRVCHEAWPRLSLGMKYSHRQRAVVERRLASALCKARAARKCGGYGPALIGVPLSFSSFLTFHARSSDREGTGIHRRHSLAKIGAEGEKFVTLFGARDDDSGADRIARMRSFASAPTIVGEGGPC